MPLLGPVELFLLTVAAVFVIGVIGEMVFAKTHVPDVIWLIVAGILIGPVGGLVTKEEGMQVAPFFGALTLVIVLFDGGSRLNLKDLLTAAPRSGLLAIFGFILSVAGVAALSLVAAGIGLLPDSWTWLHGVMLGAIVGGASSVVIMPAMQRANLSKDISNLVNLESALTDVLCVVVAGAMVEILLSGSLELDAATQTLAQSFGIGFGMGAVAGLLWILLHRMWRGSEHEYPVTLGALLVLYVLIDKMGGSAALGILTTAVIIGNAPLLSKQFKLEGDSRLDPNMQRFHGVITFMVKSFFFTFIGLMLRPPWSLLLLGVFLGLALFALRIPAVYVATAFGKFQKTERVLVTVTLPRGMAAGVLAIMPFQLGVPDTEFLPVTVFSCVFTTILIFAVGFPITKNKLVSAGDAQAVPDPISLGAAAPASTGEDVVRPEGTDPGMAMPIGPGALPPSPDDEKS